MKSNWFLTLVCAFAIAQGAVHAADGKAMQPRGPQSGKTVPDANQITPGHAGATEPPPPEVVAGSGENGASSGAVTVESWAKEATSVSLYHTSSVAPALSVLVGDKLYFTDWTDDRGCVGSGVYSYSFSKHEEKTEGDADCVHHLDVDANEVYVTTGSEGSLQSQVFRVSDGHLAPLLNEKAEALITAAINFHLYDQGQTLGSVTRRFFRVRKGKLFTLLQLKTEDKTTTLVNVSPIEDGKLLLASDVYDVPETGSLKDFDIDATGHMYLMAYSPQGVSVAVEQLGSDSYGEIARIGGVVHRLPLWQSLKETEWSVRQPLFLTATDFGFAVFDRTPRRDEIRTISLYSLAQRAFFRASFSSSSVTGLSPYRGGLLVTRANEGDVSWYGPTNPFPAEWVAKGGAGK